MSAPSLSEKNGNERQPSLLPIDDPEPASGQQSAMGPVRLMRVDEETSDAAQDATAGKRANEDDTVEDSSIRNVQVEARAPVPDATAPDAAHVSVGMSSDEKQTKNAVETRWACLADVVLRVPMCGILLFFWFEFHVLAYGPNVVVTAVNVLLNMTCMFPDLLFRISLFKNSTRISCDADLIGVLYVCFVLLPPAVACLLYRWLLATIAGIGTVLLSHYLIRDHFAHLWGTSSYRPLIETLLVSMSASVTSVLASQLSGVRRLYFLLPLMLLPIPIVLHRIRLIDAARPDTIVYEYYAYALALLLLLPAIYESLKELEVRTRDILRKQQDAMLTTPISPVSLINEQRLRRAADKTFLSANIFMFCLLLVNLVLASLWPHQSPVNNLTATALANTTNTPVANNTNDSAYAPQMTTAATTMPVPTSLPVTLQFVQLVADTTDNYRQNSTATQTDKWSFGRSFVFSIALLFESPVTLFAAASSLAVPLYALLVALDTSHKHLCPMPEYYIRSMHRAEHAPFVQHMRHVHCFDVGVSDLSTTVAYVLLALVFYGFTNTSLSALETGERVKRLLYLPIWLATCAVRLLSSALGFHLQTMPYETERKPYYYSRRRKIGLLFNMSTHVLLQVLCSFFIWLCWPHASMPFWQHFLAVVIVLNALTSVIYSALGLFSVLCGFYFPRGFIETEAAVLIIKMIWMLSITVYSLWIFALTFANEWNAVTLVALMGFVTCQGFSAGRIAVGLWTACSHDPPFSPAGRSNVWSRSHCTLCTCSSVNVEIEGPDMESSICETHRPGLGYFHTACFRMWRVDHSMCPICRDPEQHSCVRLIDYIAVACWWLLNVAHTTQRLLQCRRSNHVRFADSAICGDGGKETRAEADAHTILHSDNA